MPKIRLYSQSTNPFTAKVEFALALKSLPYERVVSDDPEDIKRWSPITRLLPVMEVNGKKIEDSVAIVAALDDEFPDPPLLSADPKTARAQQQLARWSDSSFLFYWNLWREARFPRPGDEKPVDNPTLLGKLRDGIALAFGANERPLSRLELREAEVMNGLAERLSDLSKFLGERDFYYADAPSVADISVYGMLRILKDGPMTGADDLIRERPELIAYMERIRKLTQPGLQQPELELPSV